MLQISTSFLALAASAVAEKAAAAEKVASTGSGAFDTLIVVCVIGALGYVYYLSGRGEAK